MKSPGRASQPKLRTLRASASLGVHTHCNSGGPLGPGHPAQSVSQRFLYATVPGEFPDRNVYSNNYLLVLRRLDANFSCAFDYFFVS